MKKLKSILAMALAMVMTTSLFTGCGNLEGLLAKEPTAEELMSKPFGKDGMTSGDMDVELAYEVSGNSDMEGMQMSISVGVNADLNMQFDEDTTLLDGDIEMSMMGMSFSVDSKTYAQKEGSDYVNYTLEEDGSWSKSEGDDANSVSHFTGIDASLFKDLALKEVGKEDTTYTVTGSVAYKDMSEMMEMDVEETLASLGTDMDVDWDSIVYNVTAVFDRETRAMKTMEMDIDTSGLNAEEFSIDKMYVKYTINKINGVSVDVPKDVKNGSSSGATNEQENTDSIVTMPEITPDYTVDENVNEGTSGSDDEETNTSMDYSFTFDNKTYELTKFTLGEFLNDTGFIIDDTVLSSGATVEAGDTKYLNLSRSKDDYYVNIMVGVENNSNSDAAIENCVVKGFEYDIDSCVSENIPFQSMTLAELTIGTEAGDIEGMFGEPKSTYSSEYGDEYEYEYFVDDETTLCLTIKTNENGVIVSLGYDLF